MSNVVNYHIVRADDESYVNALLNLAEHESAKSLSTFEFQFFGGSNEHCAVSEIGSNDTLLQITSAGGQVLQNVKLRSGNSHVYVHIRRPPADNSNNEQIFDTVSVSRGHERDNMLDGVQFAKLLARVQQIIKPVSASNLGPLLGPGVDKHFAAREEALNRLEQFVDKVFREMESTRKSREAEFLKREHELESKYSKKQADLESEFQAKTALLEDERASLAKLKSEIDDRSSTHARRDIRKELKQILSKTDRLKHSPETGRRRLIIGAVYVVFLSLFGTVAGVLLFRELNSGSGLDYWQLGLNQA
jgi:Skp family chaperone for outer membrane proteins